MNVDAGEEPTGNTCVYALQADDLTGLWDVAQFNPTDKYIVVMSYSENQDTAAAMVQWMIDTFESNEPDSTDVAADENTAEGEKTE